MNIFIIHVHWNNRGDEAAMRALVDTLREKYSNVSINIQIISDVVKKFPYKDIKFLKTSFDDHSAWNKKNVIPLILAYITKGKLLFNNELIQFVNILRESDLVIHAPGGPSIGDTYKVYEKYYWYRLLLTKRMKKPYVFYAPSMGPFIDKKRNVIRKYILNHAEMLCLRENISGQYVKELKIKKNYTVTLDSAFQYDFDEKKYSNIFLMDTTLNKFLKKYEICLGITITDLNWHPNLNNKFQDTIHSTFEQFIDVLNKRNIGVIFIPQLFDKTDDLSYMNSYLKDNCLSLDKSYDCYFQQYLISKLYAVIGMRYHSNIFSAKVGTPFISISYEQKMKGFMEIVGLSNYCIDVNDLSYELLLDKFEILLANYKQYKSNLTDQSLNLKSKSYTTSKMLFAIINKL